MILFEIRNYRNSYVQFCYSEFLGLFIEFQSFEGCDWGWFSVDFEEQSYK